MRQHDSFSNSGLGRAKPQRHVFRSFINQKLKRKHSHIGLVEDRTSSTTIVRIIIGLLMLHLVIIGGVLLKGHVDSLAGGIAAPPTMTPPPPVLQAEETLAPVAVAPATPATPAAPTAPVAASSSTHITAEPELFPEDGAAVTLPSANAAPVVVTPPVAVAAPETPAVPTTNIRVLVNSGDTWFGIAEEYNVSMDALKAANPTAARRSHLYQGNYINVPVPVNSPAAKAAAQATKVAAAPAAATYKVKRGDTLARIASRHKMSTATLMKINNLSEKDSRSIRPGQVLKVSK